MKRSEGGADAAAATRADGGAWLCAVAVLVPMAIAVAGLASGKSTLFFRDIFNLHLPSKIAQAAAWREGTLPLVDPFRAAGQPSLGNLNTLPLYPDNLLYLLAGDLWALNAHFWLHLLLAPFAAFWMGRAFGLSRAAAWAVGATYAFSGAYLSQAGFYNLVPAATLAPALVAAVRDLARPAGPASRRALALVATALLWALLLLGGDPILAVQALGAAAIALVGLAATDPAHERRRFSLTSLRPAWRAAPALVAGTLLVLPQIVGFAQIIGFSYRGYIGFSDASRLMASWDPRQVLEWLLPLAYGKLELGFWGGEFSGGQLPLFWSVHPGMLAIGLLVAAGKPRNAAARWGWSLVLLGLFLALGVHNPIVRAAAALPGAGLLRFPVKFFLLVSLGGSLLAGIGFERVLREGPRPLWRGLGVVLLAVSTILAILLEAPVRVDEWLAAAGGLSGEAAAAVRRNWIAQCGLQSLLVVVLGTIALALRRRPAVAAALLFACHGATQLLWLRTSLLPTDDAAFYRARPPVLRHLDPDEKLVHGGVGDMFGPGRASGLPDRRLLWIQRRGFLELYPFVGVRFGFRYELDPTAEGLDSFLTNLTLRVMRQLDDARRLRVLRALGVDALILDRPLAEPLPEWVRPRARIASVGSDAYLYGFTDSAPDAVVAGTIYRSPNVNATLDGVLHPDFDPNTAAIVPGTAPPVFGAPGEVREILEQGAERFAARVYAPGSAVLVLQRAYLPIYRAEIDGRAASLTVANVDRLALELSPGEHDIRVWADRRPLRASFLGTAVGAGWLLWLVRRRRRLDRSSAMLENARSACTEGAARELAVLDPARPPSADRRDRS